MSIKTTALRSDIHQQIADAEQPIVTLLPSVLRPFQVGDNDIVLAHDGDQALELLMATAGYSKEEVEDFEIDDLSTRLDMKLSDEDHNFLTTLGDFISNLEKPQYLFGWE